MPVNYASVVDLTQPPLEHSLHAAGPTYSTPAPSTHSVGIPTLEKPPADANRYQHRSRLQVLFHYDLRGNGTMLQLV